MTRIISGFQTQGGDWDGGAVLRGFKSGQASRLNEEQNQRANAGLAFQIQRALADQLAEETAAQQKQAAAQQQSVEMGKAGKLQQFAQRAQAGQVNPGQKFVERVIGARGRLTNKDALKLFDDSVESLLNSQKAAKKRKTFDETMSAAEKDTEVFQPEMIQDFRQQADAGGDIDSLIKQSFEHRMKTATQQRVSGENEGLLSQAEAMIQAAPPGEGRKMAETILLAARQPSQLQIEGKGSEVLQAIQEAMLPPKSKLGESQGDPYADRLLFAEAYSQLEKEGGLPVGGEPAEMQRAVQERMRMMNPGLPEPEVKLPGRAPVMAVDATVRGIVREGGGIKEIRAALEEQGIQPTESVRDMIRHALRGYTADARSGAADDLRR